MHLLRCLAVSVSCTLLPVPASVMADTGLAASTREGSAWALGARQAALMALEKGVVIQSQVLDLSLQARELVDVARGEFRPKTTLAISNQRQNTALTGAAGSSTGALSSTLTTTWKLLSGTQLTARAAAGQQSATDTVTTSNRSVTIGIVQPLLRGRGAEVASASLRSAESALRSARYTLEQAAAETVHQVLLNYFDRQQARVRVEQAKDALAMTIRMQLLNQALVDAGRSARNVLLQSEAEAAQARLTIAQSVNDESIALRTLLQAIGSELDSASVQVDTPDRPEEIVRMQAVDERSAIDMALAWQPSVRIARENVDVALLQLHVAENNQLIPLDLSVSTSRYRAPATGAVRGDTAIALTTEISFNRADLRLARSAAEATVRKAEMQWAEAQRTVRYAAIDALQQWRFAVEQLALAQTNGSIVRDRYDAEVERLRVGRASALEASVAQQSLVSAQAQLLQAQYQVVRNQLELLRVTGGTLELMGLEARVKEWTNVLAR